MQFIEGPDQGRSTNDEKLSRGPAVGYELSGGELSGGQLSGGQLSGGELMQCPLYIYLFHINLPFSNI